MVVFTLLRAFTGVGFEQSLGGAISRGQPSFRLPRYLTRSVGGLMCGMAALLVLLARGAPVCAATEDCLHTEDKVPVKVILREDAAVYTQPDKGSSGPPARIFDWFYALPTEKGGQEKLKNDFYHVAQGTGWSDAAGWVHKDAVVEWNHREAVSFKSDPDRERVLFYNSYADLNKYMLETKNTRSPQPLSQEPQNLGSGFFVMPVLDVKSISISGADTDVYRVAYLHGDGAPRPSGGGTPSTEQSDMLNTEEFQQQFTLDIVFVIDTTLSMQPWIDGVKETVRKTATTIAEQPQLKGHVRFGLVAYRDKLSSASADSQIEYLTKVFCKLSDGKDPQAFLQRVADVRDARKGSEDWSEDVIAGLKVALEDMDWNPIAVRHLILIGDASAQDNMEDPSASGASPFAYKNHYKKSLDYILSTAQAPGKTKEVAQSIITINALRIKGEYPSDWERCDQHFRKLAAGRDYPGVYRVYEQASVEPFIGDLVAQIDRQVGGMKRVVDPNSKLQDPAVRKELAGLLNAPVLLLLDTTLRPANGSSQAPSFASGWACKVDVRDNFQLEPHVLVTRGRMETFLSVLDNIVRTLERAREPGSGDVQEALQKLQLVATHVFYGEPINRDSPLADMLGWLLGIPIKSEIFNMSLDRLKNMTQENFDDWVRKVQATQQIIRASLDDRDRWRSVGSSTSEADKHAFIKVSDMP